jgi:UDP-glucose 4,6-dehydratase
MTVLSELLPIAIDLTIREEKGIFNFTNPGVISHNEILELYKKYIDPDFKWTNFSLEDQAKILKSGRSNNKLV